MDMHEVEWTVDWEDDSGWVLSWVQDAGAFFAQRRSLEEDDDHLYLDCPGPDLGLFESLETLEVAMGRSIPADIRNKLLRYSREHPITQGSLGAWGVSVEHEIERLGPDGEIVATIAAPGADDPSARRRLPEWI